MRKVIFGINMSVDGCCGHEKGNPDEELMDYWTRSMREAGTLAYGRKTYQLMVPYWPDMAKSRSGSPPDNDFAQAFAAVPEIVVFSRTLEKAERPNDRVVRTDPRDEILRMKQQAGGDIYLGGIDVPSQLMKHHLVDEYRIVIAPFLAWGGPRFTGDICLPEMQPLKLAGSKTFKSGCIELRYTKQ